MKIGKIRNKLYMAVSVALIGSTPLFATLEKKVDSKVIKVEQVKSRGMSKEAFDKILKKYTDEVASIKNKLNNSTSPITEKEEKARLNLLLKKAEHQLSINKKELIQLHKYLRSSDNNRLKEITKIINTEGAEKAADFIKNLKKVDSNNTNDKMLASQISLVGAKLYAINGQPKLAEKLYRESIEYDENIGNLFQFANFFYRQKNFTQSKKYFYKSSEKTKKPEQKASILNNMAILFNSQGKSKEALEAYNKALKIREKLAKDNPELNDINYAHIMLLGVYIFNQPTTNLKKAKEILNKYKDKKQAKDLLKIMEEYSKK